MARRGRVPRGEQVYHRLRHDLATGAVVPTERLGEERHAEAYGVNPTPGRGGSRPPRPRGGGGCGGGPPPPPPRAAGGGGGRGGGGRPPRRARGRGEFPWPPVSPGVRRGRRVPRAGVDTDRGRRRAVPPARRPVGGSAPPAPACGRRRRPRRAVPRRAVPWAPRRRWPDRGAAGGRPVHPAAPAPGAPRRLRSPSRRARRSPRPPHPRRSSSPARIRARSSAARPATRTRCAARPAAR